MSRKTATNQQEINTNLISVSNLQNLSATPILRFHPTTLHHRNLLTFTKSQLNLYKNTTASTSKYSEEPYLRYVSGALQKGAILLDEGMINKVLKRKDREADRRKKKNTGKLPLLNRARVIADRTKAAVVLSDKWTKMEDLRIRYTHDS
jgi:hypothetical protein